MSPSTTNRSRPRHGANLLQSDPLFRQTRGISSPKTPSPCSSPKKKKLRPSSRGDILKHLADDVLQQMAFHFKTPNANPSVSKPDGEPVLNSSHIEQDESECTPESPTSFLNRVGLGNPSIASPSTPIRFPPPHLPPIIDPKPDSQSRDTSPSTCASTESTPTRVKPYKSIGNITPSTAHAAQCLLDLCR